MPAKVTDVFSAGRLAALAEIVADLESKPAYSALSAVAKQAVMNAVVASFLAAQSQSVGQTL